MDFVKFANSKISGTEYDEGGFFELPRHKNGQLMDYTEVLAAYEMLSDDEKECLPIIDEDTCDIILEPEPVIWKQNWDKFLSEYME